MCQRNGVTEKAETIVGKVEFSPLSETERRQEIDYRVMRALSERDIMRGEYVRGLTDAFYWFVIFAMLAYAAYIYFKAEE